MILGSLLENIEYTVVNGDVKTCQVDRIEYNSKKVHSGELFVCLPGTYFDGHSFALSAYDSGCRAFLCERKINNLPPDAIQVITPDTRSALATISAAFYGYPAEKLHIIGITGTKGKTTTALLIQSIMNKNGIPCAYIGSNGVIINDTTIETVNTTPESRELHHYFNIMVNAGITHAVIEVSSQALVHSRVQGINFDVCVYTNLSPDHIGEGEHSSFEEYKAAKNSLFTNYNTKAIVYNSDDSYAGEITYTGDDTPKISYSLYDVESDFRGENISQFRTEKSLGVDFACLGMGKSVKVRMLTPGLFSVYNGLAAIAVCSYFGITLEASSKVLAVTPVTGRFEIVDGGIISERIFIIDYAHNELSLTKSLEVLQSYNPSRLICLFGAVGGRTQSRRAGLARAASSLSDYCILTSDNPDFEPPENITDDLLKYYDKSTPYDVILDRDEAIRYAIRISKPGDIVLFAGKGHETYQLIEGVKIPFSEREIIIDECRQIQAEEFEMHHERV